MYQTTPEQLRSIIMTRVWTVYFLRRITDPVVVRVSLLVLACGLVLFKVSLINVMANMPRLNDPEAVTAFYWEAFNHTEWLIKSLVLALIGLGLWLIKDSRALVLPMASRFNPYHLIRG
ncbi:MAG: hypothetical protein HYV76_00130 [Candidatus Vogelbacteria bacterium]|nr:hypothetical protein [Candidatus Vogelbacteria bacterium]